MKKPFMLLIIFAVASSCVKNIDLVPVSQTLPNTTQVTQQSTGMFMNGVHSVSGSVKVVVDKTDPTKKTLVFENFKTDQGPDLRIYLAEDTQAMGATEVIKLANTGNFTVDIPATARLDKQKYVLIWCKAYSVLFGSAKLD